MNTATATEQRRETVALNDEEGVKKIIVDTVFGLWGIVNNLTRLRPSKREHYRVTIFGSARIKPGHLAYDEVKRLSSALAEMGCDIVTGGGPGLMQAANEGARSQDSVERAQSVGIRVDLPFEQEVNPFVQEAYEHQTFFSRLHHFVIVSDAYVVVPGGIGTVLESMLVWQLLQVRHLRDTPLIFVGEMWFELVEWATRHMLRSGSELANPEDMTIPRCVKTVDEAIALLEGEHAHWQKNITPPRSDSNRDDSAL